MNINIAHTLETYAHEKLNGSGYEIVEIENRPGSRKYTVYIDGEHAVSIDLCIEVSRHISRRIDETLDENDEGFTFEVSSPGADRPLKYLWQLKKHIGRYLLWNDENGTQHEAEIAALNDDETVELLPEANKRKKNAEREPFRISFNQMIKPRIAIKFR